METHVCGQHAPWNRGKLFGQKATAEASEIWPFGFACNSGTGPGTSLCSTWPSTASCAGVTSLG